MRFNREELDKALTLVTKTVPSRPSHPVMGTVLFETKGDACYLTATDGYSATQSKVTVESDEDVSFCLSQPDTVNKLVSKLKCKDLTFSLEENDRVIIKGKGKTEYAYGVMDGELFPSVATPPADCAHYVVASKDLKQAWDLLNGCWADEKSTKDAFKAIGIKQIDDKLGFIASNGHIFGWLNIEASIQSPTEAFAPVPPILIKNIVGLGEFVDISIAGNRIFFAPQDKAGNTIIQSSGQLFGDTGLANAYNFTTQSHPYKVVTDVKGMKEVLDRLSCVVSDAGQDIKWDIEEGLMSLQVNSDCGTGQEDIKMGFDENPPEFDVCHISHPYMTTVIKNFSTLKVEQIHWEMLNPQTFFFLKNPDVDGGMIIAPVLPRG